MKTLMLLTIALFSSSVFAANLQWDDLELYNEYKVTMPITFENGVTLPAGDVYEMRELEALSIPGYPMFYMSFHKKDCTTPDQTAEMSILDVSDAAVGIELEEGCNLGLYLEVKDYYRQSPFIE